MLLWSVVLKLWNYISVWQKPIYWLFTVTTRYILLIHTFECHEQLDSVFMSKLKASIENKMPFLLVSYHYYYSFHSVPTGNNCTQSAHKKKSFIVETNFKQCEQINTAKYEII